MNDEDHAGGMLAGDSVSGGVPGIDPLEAVAAVAEPRQRIAGTGVREPDAGDRHDSGLLVETRVRVEPGEAGASPPLEKGVADEYGDFVWPDGYQSDPTALAKFVPLAKKLGLSRESAQSLAELYADLDMSRNRAQAEFVARNNAEWLREIHNHPEFGGPRLQQTAEDVGQVMRRFGRPLLGAQIRQMNVQNWPEMFYFLARVARAVGEDRSPASGPGEARTKSTAQLLFPGLK